MEKCNKCKGKKITLEYQAEGVIQNYNRIIEGVKKFMRDDSYYHKDKVKTEHLIYTCETCGFKIAKEVE